MALTRPTTETDVDLTTQRSSGDAAPTPHLMIVLEGDNPRNGGARFSLANAGEVVLARADERKVVRSKVGGMQSVRVTTTSRLVSKKGHARLDPTSDGWSVTDLDSTNGVYVNGMKVQKALLRPGDVFALGRVFCMIVEYPGDQGDLDLADVSAGLPGTLTLDPVFGSRLGRLSAEAKQGSPVVIVGETGTGKELLAKALHELSGRRGPYVGINCGAFSRELIASELFGHVKGAFTGAAGSIGHIRRAEQGTLLLDELVAAPEEFQVSLLRAIQENEVLPVGAKRPEAVNVRYIAAAQVPPDEAVEKGEVRRDLMARFVVRLDLPPLRERRQDIGIFVASKMRSLGITGRALSFDACNRLLLHDWPNNIRELTNTIDRWSGAADSGDIRPDERPVLKTAPALSPPRRPSGDTALSDQIQAHLRDTNGSVPEVAARLGLKRTLVYHHMKKLGIDPKKFRA
ncbi:MAG TPA: sigma 54-interacting transcriptional regulator [Polyangia bacterium]|nr:sigma 54-interacting transcriptional regulator [Polyangia bacterium]